MKDRAHTQKTPHKSFSLHKGSEKVIAGVCSGIADRLDVDVVVARVTAVVLFICTVGLITIPYIVLAIVLPAAETEDNLLEVKPTSVVSDRYEQVVEVKKPANAKTTEQYGVHADAGHVPPKPPEDGGVETPAHVYIPYRHEKENAVPEGSYQHIALVVAIAVATTAFFVMVANSIISRHPEWDLIDFWPELLVVAGVTLLVCFYERLSFVVRLSALLFCIELCLALLPFTLGIYPPFALDRTSIIPALLVCFGVTSFIVGLVKKTPLYFLIAVVLCGIALVWGTIEMGLVERLRAMESYSRHNITSPLFRQ